MVSVEVIQAARTPFSLTADARALPATGGTAVKLLMGVRPTDLSCTVWNTKTVLESFLIH
jgi:hypothetical protein